MFSLLNPIIRASQLLWTLLITALIGNVIALNIDGSMAGVNFAMFVAVLSWLAALYGLAACFVSSLVIPIALFALDGLATLFTLIAGIVLAARLQAVNCSNDFSGWPGDYIVFGSGDNQKRCREIQASTTFMWFLFVSFAIGLFFNFLEHRRGSVGSVRSSRPSMAQVGA